MTTTAPDSDGTGATPDAASHGETAWRFLLFSWPGRAVLLVAITVAFAVAWVQVWASILVLFITIQTVLARQSWRQARLFADIPTARVRSAPQGYVELRLEADRPDDRPLVSPLTGPPCHYWSIRIEAYWRTGWHPMVEAASARHFLRLRDDTGVCYALLDGMEFHGRTTTRAITDPAELEPVLRPLSGNDRRRVRKEEEIQVIEEVLPADQPIFAIGRFQTVSTAAVPVAETWTTEARAKGSGAGGLTRALAGAAGTAADPFVAEAVRAWQTEMRQVEGTRGRYGTQAQGSAMVNILSEDRRFHMRTPLVLGSQPERTMVRTYRVQAAKLAALAVGLTALLAFILTQAP